MNQPRTLLAGAVAKTMLAVGLTIIGVIVVAVIAIAAFSGDDSPDRPGNPAVYDRIAAETDCGVLQSQLDTAEANGIRDRAAGKHDAAEVSTAYMQAADERMRAIGCP